MTTDLEPVLTMMENKLTADPHELTASYVVSLGPLNAAPKAAVAMLTRVRWPERKAVVSFEVRTRAAVPHPGGHAAHCLCNVERLGTAIIRSNREGFEEHPPLAPTLATVVAQVNPRFAVQGEAFAFAWRHVGAELLRARFGNPIAPGAPGE